MCLNLKPLMRGVSITILLFTYTTAKISLAEDRVHQFDIASQALGSAITALARQANINIGADAQLLRAKQAPAVRGRLTVAQALQSLLAGSGLTYQTGGNNSVNVVKAAAPQQALAMQPITVKGELLERSVQDTQTSVSVIRGETLESRSDFDLYDVIERTPGIVSSFGDKGFSIRGIDQRSAGGGGSGLTISTTVDGAIISNTNQLTFFGPYSTWDLEQVEILRGPQSTQTGRNALAGAVVMKSKDPQYTRETRVRLEGGQNDTYGGAFAFNTPLIDSRLALRISGESLESDGFIRNPARGTDRFNARNQDTYRIALRADPVERLDAVFKFTYAENFGGADLVRFAEYPDSHISLSDLRGRHGARIDSYNLRVGYDLNASLRIESETTYYDAEYTRIEDSDNSPSPGNFLTRTSDVYSFQQELKLLFDHEKINGVVGLFYLDFTNNSPASGILDLGIVNRRLAGRGTIDATIDSFIDTDNYAVFGELEYPLTPKWKLIAGARYDREAQKIKNVNITTASIPLPPGRLPADRTENLNPDYAALLPKAGVVYDFNDDVSLGFTIQRGYRAGGADTNFATGERKEYDPEYTWNYEAAFRSQWMNNQITLNANIFYTDWQDQQIEVQLDPSNRLNSITENAGESTLYGGEIELQARPASNLDLLVSVAYVNTEFDKFKVRNNDFSGNEFAFAPELTAFGGASYYFDSGFYASADVSYTGKYYDRIANTPLLEVDSRTLVNAQFGYQAGQWRIFAYARNLFNVNYYTQAVSNRAVTAIELVRSGEPRVIGLVASINM